MMTRNRQPSNAVLETLLNVTKTILATFIGNPHFGKSYAVNLNHAHEELQDLVERITIELELINAVQDLWAEFLVPTCDPHAKWLHDPLV